MTKKGHILVLSFGHGLNDFAAGSLLAGLVPLQLSVAERLGCFLVYNLLAFGGQYFVARLLEGRTNLKPFLLAAGSGNVIAVLLFPYVPHLSLVLAGAASALYHVAGGSVCAAEGKAGPIGIFAAPGIIGLAGAGYLAWKGVAVQTGLLVACILFTLVSTCLELERKDSLSSSKNAVHGMDRHDLLMILLLGLIALRSAVWNIFQLVYEGDVEALFFVAGAAFTGKILGGWLSDRAGWRLYSFLSLSMATPLLTVLKEEFWLFCIGIGLLQSGIPAGTALLIRSLDGNREQGIALSLGTAVLAGAVLTAPIALFPPATVLPLLFTGLLLLCIYVTGKRAPAFRD